MGILSKTLRGILWSLILLPHCSDNAGSFKFETPGESDKPLVSDTPFEDTNDSFEVIQNSNRPHFSLFFSKNSRIAGKSALYKYDPKKPAFELVTLKTSMGPAKLSKVVPTGEKMFCLSSEDKIAFYINEKLDVEHEQKLLSEHEYVPNPHHPDFIARRQNRDKDTPFEVNVSINFGKEYPMFFMMLTKFDWVPKSRNIVYLTTGKNLTVLNVETNDTYVSLSNVEDFMMAQNKILIIQSVVGEKYLNLSIFDADKSTHSLAKFPIHLKIQKVRLFDFAFNSYYVITVDDNSHACLWSPTNAHFHFVRKACYHASADVKTESSFYINRQTNHVLYWNHPDGRNQLKTHRSSNDGRFWYEIESAVFDNKTKSKIAFYFDFQLRHPQIVPDNHEWIDVHFAKIGSQIITLLTLDNGHSWINIPNNGSNIVFLNSGTAILSVSQDALTVIYSFDGAVTWFKHSFYSTNQTVLHVGKLYDDDLRALIVTRDSNNNQINFKILDFKNIFKSECKAENYLEAPLLRSHDVCYQGQILLIRTRDPKIRCVDKMSEHKKSKSDCSCTGDDFNCNFNYYSFGDACVLDPLSGITEEPYKCDPGSHFAFYHAGYVKIPNDSCDPKEMNPEDLKNYDDICVQNELTDFVVLKTINKTLVSQIPARGGYFRKQTTRTIFPNTKISKDMPSTTDYAKLVIYTFQDKHLAKYHFHFGEKTDLYYLEDGIVDMVYDTVLHAIIFLTTRKQLKIVSLLSNYQQLVSDDVKSFKYASSHTFISFVTTANSICYSNLFDPPECSKSPLDTLQTYIDFDAKRVYILSKDNALVVKTFEKDIDDLKASREIPKVSHFAVNGDHLYFLVDGQLSYTNLAKKNQTTVLIKGEKLSSLLLHQASLQSFKHQCENLNCQFMCFPASPGQVKCGCPTGSVLVNNTCECPKNHPDCLPSHCAGFPCKNSKCLINNVRCNGVDDCGDGSDEVGCQQKCPEGSYMCKGKCTSKDIVCSSVDIVVTPVVPEPKKTKKLGAGYIVLIILVCLALICSSFLLVRTLYRRVSRRPLRLLLGPRAPRVEFSRLLEEEEDELYDLSH